MAQIAQEKGLLPGGGVPPPPSGGIPPPPPGSGPPPPPPPGTLTVGRGRGDREPSPGPSNKGTMKLYWKPAQNEALPVPALKRMVALINY